MIAWRIAGTYVASCSCDLICPCPVDAPPNNPDGGTECTGAGVFHIADGSLDDVDLSDVNFAFYNYWPSNLSAGNWKVGVVVDDAAGDHGPQPLPHVALDRAGPLGELGRGERTGPRHRPVKAQLVADNHQRRAGRRAKVADRFAQECLQLRLADWCGSRRHRVLH